MNWNRRTATLAGLALLALTNAVALGGAAWNRSGEPDATLRLSERELMLPYMRSDEHEDENSGLALRLQWRTLPTLSAKRSGCGLAEEGGGFPGWLDAGKMRALGFPAPPAHRIRPEDEGAYARWQASRSVLVVLEMDGPAYQEALRRAKACADDQAARHARGENKDEPQSMSALESGAASRLFAIDAGLDAATLRALYPDRTRYAIVRGRVDARMNVDGREGRGAIESIGADEVNVPLAWRGVIDGMRPYGGRSDNPAAHFQATLALGHRFEPWLVSATRR